MASIVLKAKREKSLLRRHPWIFSGAIHRVQGDPAAGQTVAILAQDGTPLGYGAYSPRSQIAVRMWHFDPDGAAVDGAFFRERLQQALAARQPQASDPQAACRLVNAESDGLPGLVVDRYAGVVVCQFLSAGIEYWRNTLIDLLSELTGASSIYERSDVDVRTKEGLQPRSGLLSGTEPPERVTIREGDCQFLVDVRQGHKTGFYLDQRDNRRMVADWLVGARLLNVFSYSGGFGISALQRGAASVVNLDSSAAALSLAADNAELNGLEADRLTAETGDAFQLLRQYWHQEQCFDAVVLDPPKFADSRHRLPGACRGYKDINLSALRLLRSGGLLFTFSCSGLLETALFQKIVADAAVDAGRDVQILARLGPAADHPVLLSFPEGNYLKGLICRVI